MHSSRLAVLVIDCNDLEVATRFWCGALGARVVGALPPQYVALGSEAVPLKVVLQLVPEPRSAKNRMHLDIHTDNLEAEVARLERLGATRIRKVSSWWTMQDPHGNHFCVVADDTITAGPTTNTWDDAPSAS